jgi:hypothetical protein
VWVSNGQARYVSVSAHGKYTTHASSQVAWSGTHARIVYHKGVTHSFRFATKDERPENHSGAWQYPTLVDWDGLPRQIRRTLASANFGDAALGITDSRFSGELAKAQPAGIPFDPSR